MASHTENFNLGPRPAIGCRSRKITIFTPQAIYFFLIGEGFQGASDFSGPSGSGFFVNRGFVAS
jgi:hypothetical protein